MKRYRAAILVSLFGVLPVAAAFGVALMYLGSTTAPPPGAPPTDEGTRAVAVEPADTRRVLAAARALPTGTLLVVEDLRAVHLDEGEVRDAHRKVGEEGARAAARAFRGHVLRRKLEKGEPLVRSAVVGPGQSGFLAAVLGPGMRAVTIQVGPATGFAGLVDPGDRVDVILTAELPDTDLDQVERATLGTVLARTILENVRVVAVDRRTDDGPDASKEGKKAQRTKMSTATLEVTPAQGNRLVLGGHEGKLALAVRALAAGTRDPHSETVDLYELLLPTGTRAPRARTQHTNEPPPPPPQTVVRMFRGTEAAEELLFEHRP